MREFDVRVRLKILNCQKFTFAHYNNIFLEETYILHNMNYSVMELSTVGDYRCKE